ncbi:MAG TPA: glucose 1-dehydrogenase [Candidatus Ozemobacteraceae bacterium]|nr:glucose 1-dehydrogenase [Candidatus Ozemobacteraceae bacterium]
MDLRLDGKRVIVTGGTRGIGRAIATTFAQAGAKLVINYHRNGKAADETVEELRQLGCEPLLVKGNAADVEFGRHLVERAVQAMGGVDILVNNAAVSHNTPFLMLETDEWHEAVDVNINALFSVTQPVLRQMIEQRIHGSILNLTSVCGVRPVAAVPVHYATTKAAIHGFTYTLAKEIGRYGIRVNGIAPGLIETAFAANLPEARHEDFRKFCPMQRIGKPAEVANLALFMVSEFNSYMTGETVVVSGGL